MIYFRLLWLAACCIALASLLLLVADQSWTCGLAGIGCTIVCVITYKETWEEE